MKCGIIGYPIKKPRSVFLWKKYFSKKNINSKMLEFNFNKNDFNKNLGNLIQDKEFLASAITMPYKISIKKYINVMHESSKLSGSTNLIIKYKKKIYGFNTDISGFLKSVSNKINIKDVVIIGMGGSGYAIFNYLNKKYKKKFILITSKRIKKQKNIKCFKSIDQAKLDPQKKLFIINCTPLGSNLDKKFINKTSINEEILKKISKNSFIFDLVYRPKKTKLNKLCDKYNINYKNGLEMNTFQASKALSIVSQLTKFKLS